MILVDLLVDFVAASIGWLLDLLPDWVQKVILAICLFIALGFLGPFCIFFLVPLILYWMIRDSKTEEKQEDRQK